MVISYGKFRTVNLGDFTYNREKDLMCPNNPIGKVDVYMTSHHGIDQSGSPALVHGLRPRVAIMNNSAGKGGAVPTMQTLFFFAGPRRRVAASLGIRGIARIERALAVYRERGRCADDRQCDPQSSANFWTRTAARAGSRRVRLQRRELAEAGAGMTGRRGT